MPGPGVRVGPATVAEVAGAASPGAAVDAAASADAISDPGARAVDRGVALTAPTVPASCAFRLPDLSVDTRER